MEQQHIARATRRTVFAGIAATLASGARAQQRDGMRRIGVLTGNSANGTDARAFEAALMQGLRVLDWNEGANLHIDWRWANADGALLQRYGAELVALSPEVLLAVGPALPVLRRQTSTIPIVFVGAFDPVGLGSVESLAHPGSNVTGFTIYEAPIAGKWLEMLTRITPPVARVALLYNPGTSSGSLVDLILHAVEQVAPSLAVAVQAAPCRDDKEIEAMMARLASDERGGLLIVPDAFNTEHHNTIITLAAQHRLPAIYPFRSYAAAGGLMSYGTDFTNSVRRSASYVNSILKGAKPADLPVQAPTKFELVINLKTAKAIGVAIAPSLLATADEVIE